jgi:hypothetical protein
VRPCSGRWSGERIAQQERALLDALAADGIALVGVPALVRSNGPMASWFMRRNGILVELTAPGGGVFARARGAATGVAGKAPREDMGDTGGHGGEGMGDRHSGSDSRVRRDSIRRVFRTLSEPKP